MCEAQVALIHLGGHEIGYVILIQSHFRVGKVLCGDFRPIAEAAFPLLFKQREILKLLIQDRQDAHRKKINDGKKPTAFDVGDLVMVRVEVKTSDDRCRANVNTPAGWCYVHMDLVLLRCLGISIHGFRTALM